MLLVPADQTSLVLTKLDEDFTLAEWLIWVVDQAKGEWLPAHPLQSLYRRWILGDRWRQRFYDENWTSDPHAKDIPSFSTLLRFGFLEKGTWGQEQFYRLSEQAKSLIRTRKRQVDNHLTLILKSLHQWEHGSPRSNWVN